MKKIVLTLMMLSAIGIASAAHTPSSLVVTMKSPSSFNVSYKGTGKRSVQITITDERGNTLAWRMVKHAKFFNLPVTLQNLAPGKYYVIANDGKERIVKEVVTNKSTELHKHAGKLYSHVFDLGNKKHLVTLRSFVREQPVEIEIYDSRNRLVLSEPVTVSGEKAIVFNTRRVKGIPKFVVTDPSGKAEVIQNEPVGIAKHHEEQVN